MSSSKNKKALTGFLLWQAGNVWQRKIKTVLDPVGLTHVQYLLLDSLDQLGGKKHPVSQVKLARKAGTDVMMTSKVVRLLMKKKFVGRKSDEKDARAFQLELTREGARAILKAKKIVAKNEGKFFSKISSQHKKFADCLLAICEE
jgi:DNA-binding MarR family transcriptional regulator